LVGIIPFAVLGLWGKPLFGFVFGAEWEFSGYLAQLIAPWLFAVMLVSPLSSVLVVMEKQRISMWYNILLLFARFSSLLFGGFILNDVAWAIGLYSATGFLFFVTLGIYSFKLAGVNIVKTGWFVLKITIMTLLPLILLKIWL
jgi:O-antigen/teichoic acid export membrane protein